MKDFFKTTVGRFVISLAFAVGTLVVAQVAQFVTDNPDAFNPYTLLVINAVLFGIKNLLDPKVKNV